MNIRTRLISLPTRVTALGLSLLTGVACGDEAANSSASAEAGKAAPKLADVEPEGKSSPAVSSTELLKKAKTQFSPLPAQTKSADNPITPEKVALGRALYHDKRLSKDHDVSCATCHDLANYGVDGDPTSTGHKGQKGDRNSPTVYNSGLQLAQFWDGRAKDVEEQAVQPMLNPIEMAMTSEAEVVGTIESIPGYAPLFEAAFPGEKVSFATIGKAIGAFERTLVTPAPFDRFLGGDLKALDSLQLSGLALFFDAECVTCHTGAGVGGSMYQKLGSVKAFETKDEGRFGITNDERDKQVFKVPLLRNITKTGPYLHDGSVATLEEMVALMVKHQTNKGELDEAEMKAMLAFLGSLTGPLPAADAISAPELPESGPNTRAAGQSI
jgi:cytochrome c peroxidase